MGTSSSAKKAALTKKQKYGEDYFKVMGSKSKTKTGGFASLKVGTDGLTGRERAKLVGRGLSALQKTKSFGESKESSTTENSEED
jgi:hypothetical protein